MALVHETVKAELNARRQGTASTKTRGEVAMTGAKAFRQKGTGRARAGALSTPQRVGGGVAFGPSPRKFVNKVNRKARRRALRAVAVRARPPRLARRRRRRPVRHAVDEEGVRRARQVRRGPRARRRRARGRGGHRQVVPQHARRRGEAVQRDRAWPTSSARRGSCSRRPRSTTSRPIARKKRGGRGRMNAAQRAHPADRLREELRAARGQQVHVPRRLPRAQDAGAPGRRGGLRRPRARRRDDEREVEAQAPRLHLGPLARVEEGDRRSCIPRTTSSCSRVRSWASNGRQAPQADLARPPLRHLGRPHRASPRRSRSATSPRA